MPPDSIDASSSSEHMHDASDVSDVHEHEHDHDVAYGDAVDMPDDVPAGVRERIDAIASVMDTWADPDAAVRRKAVEQTLHAENLFTEEATAFALNQWSATATPAALAVAAMGPDAATEEPERLLGTVYVQHGTATPVDGLREVLVALAAGWSVRSLVPDHHPALVPAVLQSLREASTDAHSDASGLDVGLTEALPESIHDHDILVLAANEDSAALREHWREAGGTPERVVERPGTMNVAIIDGSEAEEERHNLAEDALLHEGQSPASLAVLWAPEDLTPDPMLQAMADFRGVFPAHEATPGTLEMQRAFLEAQDASHAYAAGMQFLVSRGDPEPQRGAHLRWSEYSDLAEVAAWVEANADAIGTVTARASLQSRLPDALQPDALREHGIDRIEPGYAHRRPLVTDRVEALLRVLFS